MIKKLLIIKYSNMDIKLDINPDKAADLYNDKDFIIDKIRKLDVQYAKLPQLLVPEAPMSVVSPLLNFRNYFRKNELRIFESS